MLSSHLPLFHAKSFLRHPTQHWYNKKQIYEGIDSLFAAARTD
ncbi:hypothetical protein ACFWUO_00925 [Bacillus subtilis]|uniref:Uncharacterized protein n=1 Tax=Bacillus subtilis TaxID=1423 RepID=A0AAP1E1A3_BACIU|nr:MULTISPECIES: hypothetical protein [Bacillus]AKE25068.1 hypothetical protein BsLM_3271 [Bacillus sp. LM 4-2]EHA32694.1 hypothetical protein BSSC8_09510 [Bacillus subtilis subsp. subtilis str. SC-8]CCU60318.1 hypothetical protein BSUBE1_3687 [Bacillus subtilis E1]BAO93527.1 hypothetical protein BSNT_09760 [Bacillus subtilis subsp. natto BEST195]GAK81933.1 hypothetical protein BSMD_038690 [Bacillus subtilis Miyagi-4]